MQEPIDAVITWIDGDEPAHREKMRPYLEATGKRLYEDSTATTRFRSMGEIFYCVASILRFAPYVRKIFIVTDRQDPKLDDFVLENFPDNKIPIIIVDHTEIYKGYEKYLPVFCSRSIESCLFRITSLSENFIYFNDDILLARPTCPEDWFVDDKAIARGRWKNYALFKIFLCMKPRKNGRKPIGFKNGMLNAAKAAGHNRRFFLIRHTPHTQKKSVMERFYSHNPQLFEANISHRFRSGDQYNPQVLFYLLGLRSGECVMRNKLELLYMKPVGRGKGYINRKMRDFKKHNPKFICVGSLDRATADDRATIEEWLKKLLNITLPISK